MARHRVKVEFIRWFESNYPKQAYKLRSDYELGDYIVCADGTIITYLDYYEATRITSTFKPKGDYANENKGPSGPK